MKTDYEFRQELYSNALKLPQSNLPGFALFKSNHESQHIILGEDHSVGATLGIMRALDGLVDSSVKTLVIGETPHGARDYFIRDVADAFEYRKEMVGWHEEVIKMLLQRNAHLMTHDSKRLSRQTLDVKDVDNDSVMQKTQRRDYLLAQTFSEQTKKYEKVIGIYGSTHVVSPIFDRVLQDMPVARYVFIGFKLE